VYFPESDVALLHLCSLDLLAQG